MNPSVSAVFSTFSTQFEGRVEYMYVDVLNFVTIGIGNLIDPVTMATSLPFVHKADRSAAATAEEITAEWTAVKGDPALGAANPLAPAGHLACAPLTQLMLTSDAIDALVLARAEQNAAILRQTPELAGLDDWPADAQLALHSLAWAMGAAFAPGWPSLRAACAAQDWTAAAAASSMSEAGNPGVRPRNVADRVLFANAAYVVDHQLDATTLHYVPAGERATLTQGGTGGDVDYLQQRLTDLGYLSTASGTFDGDTNDAVRRLQTDTGLTADAVVGPSTWAATGTCIPAS